MTSFDMATLSGAVFRPLIVLIAHIPILLVAMWMMAVVRPSAQSEFGLKVLRELRTWSRDVIGATGGMPQR